jgi:STE24 endopeptidase
MNTIAIIIFLAIFFDFILNLLADYLNLGRLSDDLPLDFKGVYEPERYRRSQEYLKINTRFGWVTATFELIVILGFWFGRGFGSAEDFRSWINGCAILTTDRSFAV